LVDYLEPSPQESCCELELGEGWYDPSVEADGDIRHLERGLRVDDIEK
jgi:hypothetical protein